LLTKKALIATFTFLMMGTVLAVPTVNCSLYRNNDYSVSRQMPLYNGFPFKFDLRANTLDDDLIEGRVEAKQPVRYGDLVVFRTTLYINLFEVISRDQFILVLPFGRSYFQRIRFEGHELACRIL
jgi:hypothetical protein